MVLIFQVTQMLWLISHLSGCSSAYELQDTIHTLREENLHMQHRLDNLTQAVREMKHLLKVSGGQHDTEFLHVWKEWSQQSINAETQQMLEQALCLTEIHGGAQAIFITPGFLLLLSTLVSINLLLLS